MYVILPYKAKRKKVIKIVVERKKSLNKKIFFINIKLVFL